MTTRLSAIALAGILTTIVALFVLHVVPTGLSAVRDPVSAYGISPRRTLYRVQTLGTAVAAGALAVVLGVAPVAQDTPAVVTLVVLATARAVISWVPMDAAGAAKTPSGRWHNVLAFGAFAAASVGGFMTGIAFEAQGWSIAATISTTLGWAMTAASAWTILAAALKPLRPTFGLAERAIYVAMLAWLAMTATALLVG